MSKLIDSTLLKRLIPADSLNADNFQELASKTKVETLAAGTVIFKKGEQDQKSIYLLEGEVQLFDGKDVRVIKGGKNVSKHPFANRQPRPCTAKAVSKCRITRIDTSLLDILMSWDQLSGIRVADISSDEEEHTSKAGDDTDWMTRVLHSPVFRQLPPANIQAIFLHIQEVNVKKGAVIAKQGASGDHYYMIKKGKCKVTRTTKTGTKITLAHLESGDSFGEEALLSDAKRNADVEMITDGTLAKLPREDFNKLLKEPALSWLTSEEANRMVKEEGAVWLDVRLADEHKNNAIQGSLNIPLFVMRLKASTLSTGKRYILYCDTGKRSSVAAFLLNNQGIDAYCLKGGLVQYNAKA